MARKIIETEIIEGVELEYSKTREGVKCKCCGRPLNKYDGVKTCTPTCTVAYVCRDCIYHRHYGSDIENADIISGRLTKGRYRFAIEVEAMYKRGSDRTAVDAYLAASYGLQPSNDCTVDVEYHMTNGVNFHGLKEWLKGISEQINLDKPNCGHHINISKLDWTAQSMDKIRENSRELFEKLLQYLLAHLDECEKVFGRYFSEYADANRLYRHGSYISTSKTYNIEFRLPHYKNEKQFFYCANWCRDCTDLIDNWLNSNDTVENTANEIVKLFKKYAQGKANCMRNERNKAE